MSTVRTQADRYWIQVEVAPDFEKTAAKMLDLNMVDEVDILRKAPVEGVYEIAQVIVVYGGVMQPFGLTGKYAKFFYEEWTKFISLKAEAPIAEPSVIQAPSSSVIRVK